MYLQSLVCLYVFCPSKEGVIITLHIVLYSQYVPRSHTREGGGGGGRSDWQKTFVWLSCSRILVLGPSELNGPASEILPARTIKYHTFRSSIYLHYINYSNNTNIAVIIASHHVHDQRASCLSTSLQLVTSYRPSVYLATSLMITLSIVLIRSWRHVTTAATIHHPANMIAHRLCNVTLSPIQWLLSFILYILSHSTFRLPSTVNRL